MKLTDIISTNNQIKEGEASFFIAADNFTYNGLPILKDSLVYYNGSSEIKVNLIAYGIFQETNVPALVKHVTPEDDEFNFIVDKSNSCECEEIKLSSSWRGLWHNNHFDKWTGRLSDYHQQIDTMPILEYDGISFSSLMYNFDTRDNSLSYFINLSAVDLKIDGGTIRLPELLEISCSNGIYSILPLKRIEYFEVPIAGHFFINIKTGLLSGLLGDALSVSLVGHKQLETLTLENDFPIEISKDGSMEIKLFDDMSLKLAKYKVRKLM